MSDISNRKAFHNFFIQEKFQAGIVLSGCEVKSLRDGKGNLQDSFARVHNGELWLHNMHISPYFQGNIHNPEDPTHPRKLLLKRPEINRLIGKMQEKGLTLIPLRVYLNERGFFKVELGLGKGKKLHDKRTTIKKKETAREIQRALRQKA
jgi:SsrA-binding protein